MFFLTRARNFSNSEILATVNFRNFKFSKFGPNSVFLNVTKISQRFRFLGNISILVNVVQRFRFFTKIFIKI